MNTSAPSITLDRRLIRAKAYADQQFLESPSLGELARIACMSEAHFVRQFKRAFDITPSRYVTAQKLERSRRLLAETGLDVTEILFASGFSNRSAFSRLFKQHFKVSPRQYRQNVRSAPKVESMRAAEWRHEVSFKGHNDAHLTGYPDQRPVSDLQVSWAA